MKEKKYFKVVRLCVMVVAVLFQILGGAPISVAASNLTPPTPSVNINLVTIARSADRKGYLCVEYGHTNPASAFYVEISVTDHNGQRIAQTQNGSFLSGNLAMTTERNFVGLADGEIVVAVEMKDQATDALIASDSRHYWLVCNEECDGDLLGVWNTWEDYRNNDASHLSSSGHCWIAGAEITPADCTNPNMVHYTCARCGAEKDDVGDVAALGHDYTSVVTKEPTVEEEGIRTYTCTRCNDSYTEAIEKLQPDTLNARMGTNTPDTGNGNTEGTSDTDSGNVGTTPDTNHVDAESSTDNSGQTYTVSASNSETELTSPKTEDQTDSILIPVEIGFMISFCGAVYLVMSQKKRIYL